MASASVLIVGGGLAGLTAAYHLQRRGCRATDLGIGAVWDGSEDQRDDRGS